MKTSLICLAIAVVGRIAFDQTIESVPVFRSDTPPMISIAGGVNEKPWLEIRRFNLKDYDQTRGFDPSFTYMVSDYMPVPKKMKDGKWQITFTSEIARDIP